MATTFTVAIDWDHDGTWTDETAHTRRVQIKSGFDAAGSVGRGDANVAGVGRCTLTLDNTAQRFSPGYAASPLYGKLLPRRAVRVQASDGVTTWTLFRGFIERIQPDTGLVGGSVCVIECVDAVALLVRQRIGTTYAATKPVDEAISAVVDATYTPPGSSYSDNGDSLTHYGRSWLPERTTALDALREICEAVYGRFYIARDGTAIYLTRDDRLDSSGAADLRIGVGDAYWQQVKDIDSAHLVGLWRLSESSGTAAIDSSGNGHNGVYSGVTLAALTGPDGEDAPLFDGVNDDVDLYSTGLASAFSSNAGTLVIWLKAADASFWTTYTAHTVVYFGTGGLSYIVVRKGSNPGQFYWRAEFGGVAKAASKFGVNTTDWVCVAMTWDKAADAVKFYWDGAQEGATLTGLGTWNGALMDTYIGSLGISQFWLGGLALCGLWNTALSDAEIAQIASV